MEVTFEKGGRVKLTADVTVDGKRTFPDEDTMSACIYVRSKEIVWLFP